MDEIPIPDFDDYFASLRRSTLAAAILPALPIETSRGCWWGMKHHCTFCGLNGKGMVFRSKSPDRVLDELEYLSRRHDIHRFQVVDNILDDKYFNSVIPRLAKSRPRYSLFMECKSNVSRHDVRSLSNAGVRWVQPGIESLHDNLLALMKKGTTAHINTQLLKWSREYGIRLYWLVLFGFPGERDDWYAQMAEWLPLIVHLEPPIGMTAISFDRFSPYHTTPEAFGLSNLQPVDWYSYVYPLAPDALTEVACYFDDHEARRARSDTDSLTDEHTRPGLAALRRVLAEWRQLWDPFNTRLLSNGGRVTRGEGRPILSMRERDRGIVIVDTRPVADERETLLEGRAADVYRACDVARTDQGLTKALAEQFQWKPTWSEIQRILTELVSRRLVVELSGHFLSLAVREPSRPYPAIYPGGGVTGRW